jgi:hypothetical protein
MTLYQIILPIHIASGAIGLLLGIIILVLKKGDKLHKQLGKIFSVTMLLSAMLSFALSILHPNLFLFCVGILTVHLVATGWRYLFLKKLDEQQKPLIIDWLLLIMMALFGISFLIIGVRAIAVFGNVMGIAPIAFGLLGLKNCYTDYNIFKGKITIKNYWLTMHLERMSAAFIASLTAFLVNVAVVQIEKIPALTNFGFVFWILPGIIIGPIIGKWKRKYEIKKNEEGL